jgi:hypothetical protein
MVKVLNTNGILTLSDFVHALRHGSIAEQIQDEKDKCSFTGSLGCPQERVIFERFLKGRKSLKANDIINIDAFN